MIDINLITSLLYIAGIVLLLDTVMIAILLKMVIKHNKILNRNNVIIQDSVEKTKTSNNVIEHKKAGNIVTERHESRRGFWYEITKDLNTKEILLYRDSNNQTINMREYKVA